MAERLVQLHRGIQGVIAEYTPEEAAVEETFVNQNPASTLKLGQARGAVMTAAKEQVGMMVRHLLPGCSPQTADAADALAVAICHAHHRGTANRLRAAVAAADLGSRR